jgi:hypothetical protein
MLLSSDLWVHALIRRVELAGSFATVVRKGDARGGAVLVKTIDLKTGQARLWSRATGASSDGADDTSFWMRPTASEQEAELDAYITRAARIDPDIWVVEIEDADGSRFLTEAVKDD